MRLELNRGEVFRLEGPLDLRVESGAVVVSGGRFGRGATLKVPKAKSIPLEAEREACIAYSLGREGEIEPMPERTIPSEWDALVAEVVRTKPQRILVMGDIDVGKTFFTTYLGNALIERGIRVAAIDGDVGQADIGPPTTIGMGLFERPVALLHEVPLRSMHFVGSTSPSGHMLEFITGVEKLMAKAKGAGVVTVNTPGWITGPGRALQLALVELIRPELLVAIQRETELDPVLAGIGEVKIRRLPVSKAVRPRTPAERASLRRSNFAEYFEEVRRFTLKMRTLRFQRCYFRTGKALDLKTPSMPARVVHAERISEGVLVVSRGTLSRGELSGLQSEFGHVRTIREGDERNLLVGLADAENELLGLGIINKIDYLRKRIVITTPLKETREVRVVQFGSIRVRRDGVELGSLKPWGF